MLYTSLDFAVGLKNLFENVRPLWVQVLPFTGVRTPVASSSLSLSEEISGGGRRGRAFRGVPNLGIPLIIGC